ncbi:hypothetical protein AYL99_01780 [Fonsecaea erecta]|uniref:Nicotianamine synthase n=1 Tax=Fonsecaea erecta TaxID=1367422 RepID=A0A178ZTP2_9EURO|nr:hypothetical protein AYL99_01780 [Fonsecaea erecta]OAP62553.1 hypothetical protein AYL99_01780 [Fonsecaea erecta]
MVPHAISGPESTGSVRDLQSEAQYYVRKMTINITNASSLGPLDTPEKADELVALWDDFYEVIAFTTLDSELEREILEDPAIIKIMPDIRRILGESEVALEKTWADRVVAVKDPSEARKIFVSTPLHEFYEHVVKAEWSAMLSILGRTPTSVAILGSGAMPETGIWITDWAQKNGQQVHIYSLELFPDRLEQGRKVYDALTGSKHCTFEAGDVRTTPQDLSAHDIVYFNAAVGTTTLEKETIILDVVKRMRVGAYMITRSTHSLKTMAYPPAQIQTPRVFKKLRPVQTCHLNGERGKNASASFIISRVV